MPLKIFPDRGSIDGVEVRGEVILGYLDGMENYSLAAYSFLAENGITNINKGDWYPLKALINSFEEISLQGGFQILERIGEKMITDAIWPRGLSNLEDAITSIDIAYHMNHKRDGIELYDYKNKIVIEGNIGHNYFEETDKQNNYVKYVCNSFYPCDFDRGMIQALASKFKPIGTEFINVEHDMTSPCRKHGGDSCTYMIKWY